MSLPYIPLYVDDYEAATAHLTIEEDGAYNRLLRLCWRTPGCSVPDDPKWIMRKMRVSADDYYRIVEPLIDEFFTRGMGRVFSPRLQLEMERATEAHEKRSQAAKKRWQKPKSLKNNETAQSNASALHMQPEPEPEPERDTNVSLIHQSDFDAFWKVCPRKVGKGAARKAYAAAVKKTDPQSIFSAMSRYAQEREGKDAQYTVHPATWLNQERWADEPQEQPTDFYQNFEAMLRGQDDGLQLTDQRNRGADKSVSSPVQAAGTHGQRGEDGAGAPDRGGNQSPYLSLIQPKRFGGSR